MAQKQPNLVQNLHFWLFWAKYYHFLHILSNVRPKNNVNKVPRWVFRHVGNKTFDFSSKKQDFLPKTPIFFIIFNKNACQLQINTSSVTYELHHSVFLVDFLSHPPSLLRISVTSAIKESSNGRTIRIRLTTTIFSGSH